MRETRKRGRRTALASIVLGVVWFLGSIAPAKALYCAEPLDTACTVVFGTYCKITKQYPCFP